MTDKHTHPTVAARVQRLIDESDIRSLALRYAQAVDRRDADALAGLFLDDGAIVGPTFELLGQDRIATIPKGLDARYDRTYHVVYNHLMTIDGDSAEGEVYSMAHHVKRQKEDRGSDYIMTITYRDRYARRDRGWFFRRREVDRLWTQTLEVDLPRQRSAEA